MNKRYFVIVVILSLFIVDAEALNQKIIGKTYPVVEMNLITYWVGKLKQWQNQNMMEKYQNTLIEKIKKKILRPKRIIIPVVKRERIYFFDPSIELKNLPLNMYPQLGLLKSIILNPLHTVPMATKLLFFDAADSTQLCWAKSIISHSSSNYKLILTGGDILKTREELSKPIYFDQQGRLLKHFNITHIPAMVSGDGNRLRIDEQMPCQK